MKKKLSLTNLTKTELKKSEMRKTLGGTSCAANCTCGCNSGLFAGILVLNHQAVEDFTSQIEEPPR